MVLRVATGGDGRLDDVGGRGEVRLSDAKTDHVFTRRLQGLGFGVDSQRGRFSHRRDPGRNRGAGCPWEGAIEPWSRVGRMVRTPYSGGTGQPDGRWFTGAVGRFH